MLNWKKLLLDNIHLLFFILLVILFFYPFVFFGKIPIPADTIVGMYHPWRDVVWDNYTAGVPFKNFLITDPVRQQYVWRYLAIEQWKSGNLPIWNPYSFSGTPLLANFQSAAFYPLNLLFFILPFNLAWGILIILQPLLSGIFLYLYLKEIRVSHIGSLLGSIAFAFSGFNIAWMEWNTIGHTVLWLPLTLLAIEKIIQGGLTSKEVRPHKEIWSVIFTFSLVSSFFAGHLQVFFYSFLICLLYLIIKIILLKKNKLKVILLFALCFLVFMIISFLQWFPTLQFISVSARDLDQGSFLKSGFFLPWQNLIQFLVPDFFGNPATGNYWGVWNYGEFISFIGIIPLLFALYGLVFNISRRTLFFGMLVFLSLIFALPTWVAQLPFILQIPLINSSQPTRLIFIADFSLCVLAALGFDHFIKNKNIKRVISILLPIGLLFILLWLMIIAPIRFKLSISPENLIVTKRNLLLPTGLFIISFFLLLLFTRMRKKLYSSSMIYIIIVLTVMDLLRFSWKFISFSKASWIYPETKIINILKQDKDNYRIMSLDRRVMPPNFGNYYHFSDVSGYDPLYLKWYGQLVAAWERGKPDITPASFNRIVTPMQFDNFITDLLGVKYFISLEPINSPKVNLVATEGTTYLYENKTVFPRIFFVERVIKVNNRQEEIETMFQLDHNLNHIGVTSEEVNLQPAALSAGEFIQIVTYSENYKQFLTQSKTDRLLILTDIYYPSWRVFIDGQKAKLLRVDFALQGVIVPVGKHRVEFKANLL